MLYYLKILCLYSNFINFLLILYILFFLVICWDFKYIVFNYMIMMNRNKLDILFYVVGGIDLF